MKSSRLKNKTNKSGKEEDKRLYNIQQNKDSKLNNKLKKTYFNEKLPKGNNVKDFWNTVNLTLQTRVSATMTESYSLKMIKF